MINQSTESIDMCETVNEISCPDVCWLSSACCNQSQINWTSCCFLWCYEMCIKGRCYKLIMLVSLWKKWITRLIYVHERSNLQNKIVHCSKLKHIARRGGRGFRKWLWKVSDITAIAKSLILMWHHMSPMAWQLTVEGKMFIYIFVINNMFKFAQKYIPNPYFTVKLYECMHHWLNWR